VPLLFLADKRLSRLKDNKISLILCITTLPYKTVNYEKPPFLNGNKNIITSPFVSAKTTHSALPGVIQPRQLFARRATPGGNRLHAFGGRVSVTAILAHA
jgi:hypothetical protein